MSASSNVGLVQQAYAAFGAGDLPRLLGFMTPDIVWDFPRSSVIPWAGTFKGPDQVARFFAALVEHSEALAFEPRHFIASEDRVVVLGSDRFRVKATGKTFECEWAHAFTLRDGKIAAFREYTDTAAVAAAFGHD